MKQIDFHPEAVLEANDAVDYYNRMRFGLGEDFRMELEATLQPSASSSPSQFQTEKMLGRDSLNLQKWQKSHSAHLTRLENATFLPFLKLNG